MILRLISRLGLLSLSAALLASSALHGQEDLPVLEKALKEVDAGTSAARQRLSVRRVIRDADKAIEAAGDQAERWPLLEFRFRAQQQLIQLDDDSKHRAEMLETCRELVRAPDEFAALRLKADLLLSQVEQAKKGDGQEARADALRAFVDRYVGTPAGPEAIKAALRMATEFGDSRLIRDLREIMQVHYAADPEMIVYQREQFQGEVFGAPFAGTLESSEGKLMRFPMDTFGTSAFVLFWSKEGEGMQHVQHLAEACKAEAGRMPGRLRVLSCNLDELDDAGESVVRGFGVDWPCLHLPGGRENPIYKTYADSEPFLLRLSATSQAGIAMGGVRRHKEDGRLNYESTLGSYLARPWTHLDYSSHLRAMAAGEFLVIDPAGKMDPSFPPELKAVSGARSLEQIGGVPDDKLQAIQACFVAPPLRPQLSYAEQVSMQRKAVDLCRKAIEEHPNASNLWVIRNRLMVALMALWKTEGKVEHLEAAFVEAKVALEAGYPEGTDLVARFCLARQDLRRPNADGATVIDRFIHEAGDKVSGPALAVGCLLALDVGDRVRFGEFREQVVQEHTEDPMMWLATSFLLDRHHRYWMFQVPYTFGWIYHLREGHSIAEGDPEKASRSLRAELRDSNGKPFRIPEDLTAEYTMVLFAAAEPWNSKRDDGLPTSPAHSVHDVSPFIEVRPGKDVELVLAVLGDEVYDGVFVDRAKKELPCKMLSVPGGLQNPLIHRIGLSVLHKGIQGVLLDKDGRILVVSSSLSPQSTRAGSTVGNLVRKGVARQDELKVLGMIEKGETAAAKEFILTLVPHVDPDAVDEKGRKSKQARPLLSQLRARARVYEALEDWEMAYADAEVIVGLRAKMDADMSRRSAQLDVDEAFRDEMKARLKK